MREIKFRAWDGEHMRGGNNYSFSLVGSVDDEGKLYPDVFADHGSGESSHKVVFMQYTGLTDREEHEIYEGDIVRSYHQRGAVIYASGSFGFWADERTFLKLSDIMEVGDGHKLEVLGNIYENKDLLR